MGRRASHSTAPATCSGLCLCISVGTALVLLSGLIVGLYFSNITAPAPTPHTMSSTRHSTAQMYRRHNNDPSTTIVGAAATSRTGTGSFHVDDEMLAAAAAFSIANPQSSTPPMIRPLQHDNTVHIWTESHAATAGGVHPAPSHPMPTLRTTLTTTAQTSAMSMEVPQIHTVNGQDTTACPAQSIVCYRPMPPPACPDAHVVCGTVASDCYGCPYTTGQTLSSSTTLPVHAQIHPRDAIVLRQDSCATLHRTEPSTPDVKHNDHYCYKIDPRDESRAGHEVYHNYTGQPLWSLTSLSHTLTTNSPPITLGVHRDAVAYFMGASLHSSRAIAPPLSSCKAAVHGYEDTHCRRGIGAECCHANVGIAYTCDKSVATFQHTPNGPLCGVPCTKGATPIFAGTVRTRIQTRPHAVLYTCAFA